MTYKLNQPKKNTESKVPFYLFAGLLCSFLVWIMLIRPMTLPADKMPFIFVKDPAHNSHSQKEQYFLLTAGPILFAGLFMIPVVKKSNRHDYALALLWANRNNIHHEDFMQLCDMLNPNMLKDNGANAMIAELQKRVNNYGGVDMRVKDYGMKKQYAENLVAA